MVIIMQHFSILLILVLFFPNMVLAKDLGVHGHSFKVSEPDFLEFIEKRLSILKENGTLGKLEERWQQKASSRFDNLPMVGNITETKTYRSYFWDPTITVKQDIHDHQHRVMHAAGTQVNPLAYRSLSKVWIFFDGSNKQQQEWAHHMHTTGNVLLITVAGSPIQLSKQWQHPVFYDQYGHITKKLGIQHVPAVVTQDKKRLQIEEVPVGMDYHLKKGVHAQ